MSQTSTRISLPYDGMLPEDTQIRNEILGEANALASSTTNDELASAVERSDFAAIGDIVRTLREASLAEWAASADREEKRRLMRDEVMVYGRIVQRAHNLIREYDLIKE